MHNDDAVKPKGEELLGPATCSSACEITSEELIEINDLAMRVLKSRQNVGNRMKESARKVREITWRLATSQKPPNGPD